MPLDLDAFVAWVEGMNSHMHAAGRQLGKRLRFDVVHGHDWLVAGAAAALAERLRCPYLTTIHATEYGRHQGWVDKHPQSYIHGIETWMAGRADRVITCSHYMRGHVADVFEIDERRGHGDPQRHRPRRPAPGRRPRRAARALRRARRAARAARRPARLREGLSARARRAAAGHPPRRAACASSSPARARTRPSCAAQARRLGLDAPRHVHGLDRRRRPALALPDRRPLRGAEHLRAVRPRRAGGDGERLPVHRRRHRRPARGRARTPTSACASARATRARWRR